MTRNEARELAAADGRRLEVRQNPNMPRLRRMLLELSLGDPAECAPESNGHVFTCQSEKVDITKVEITKNGADLLRL